MQVLKQKYLQLSIHRQIQVGVVSVSFCVCFLVFLLLALNSFILINLSYNSTTDLLEKRDNQQIELLALYVDNTLNVMTEKNKISIQILRNLIQNYKRTDFISHFNTMDVTKYISLVNGTIPTCNIATGCIYYKMLDKDYSKDANFIRFLSILSASYTLLERIFYFRYYGLTSTPIFRNIQILSNEFKTIFYYSKDTTFNKDYTLENFVAQANTQTLEGSNTYYNTTRRLNKITNMENIENINKNPHFSQVSIFDGITLPYLNPFDQGYGIITTNSLYYNPLINATTKNLLNFDNVVDLIIGDVSPNVIDTFTFVSIERFNGVMHIIANVNDNIVTPSSCQYLIKFARIFMENDTYSSEIYDTPIKPEDCFFYPPAKEKIKFYYDDKPSISTFKRKVRLSFVNNFNSTDDIKFKILMLTSPDVSTRLNLDSALLFNIQTFIYIIKNQEENRLIVNNIYYHYVAVVFFILLFNLAIWYVVITIISILLYNFSNSISKPISFLVEQVTCIGQEKILGEKQIAIRDSSAMGSKKEKMKNALDDIKFPHDKDIDDLFQICKVLIKGGFTEDASHNNNNRMRRLKSVNFAYNNISIIKANNLIIQEDLIENNATSKEYAIFHYKIPDEDPQFDYYENKPTDEVEKRSNYMSGEEIDHKETFFNIDENIHDHSDLLLFVNGKNILPSNLNHLTSNKNSKSSENNKVKIEKEIFDIIKKEEESLEGKSYLYKICMEHTNEGKDIEMITI